jgi:hypothetical protein
LIARIRRTLQQDVTALLGGATDAQGLAARLRAHLLGLLEEAEVTLRRLRREAEAWHERRTHAEQAAAVETQLAVLAGEGARTALVVAARERAERQRAEAAHAEREERRLRGAMEALLAVMGSLRAMLARLTGEGTAPGAPAPPGSEHMARAAELVAEIDALNDRAFAKIREMQARAARFETRD